MGLHVCLRYALMIESSRLICWPENAVPEGSQHVQDTKKAHRCLFTLKVVVHLSMTTT